MFCLINDYVIAGNNMSGRQNPQGRNPQPIVGSGSVYPGEIGKESHGAGPVGWREPIPSGEPMSNQRPSRSQVTKSGSMRKQEQLTFDFEDSFPLAPRNTSDQKILGGERGKGTQSTP